MWRALTRLFVGIGLTQCALFVSGLLIARLLGPLGRGQIASAMLVVTLASFVIANSGSSLVNLHVSRGANVLATSSNAMQAMLPISLVVCTAAALVLGWAGMPPVVVVGGGVSSFLFAVIPVQMGVLAGCRRYASTALLQFLPPGLYSLVLGVLLILRTFTVETVMYAWYLSALVGAIVGYLLVKAASSRVSPSSVRVRSASSIRRRGLRGLLSLHSPLESFRLDQLLVVSLGSNSALGYYVAGLSLANLPKLLGQVLATVVPARLSSSPGAVKSVVAAVLAPFVGGLLIAPLAPWAITLLFGGQFNDVRVVAALLCVAGGAMGSRKVLNEVLRFKGQDGIAAKTELAVSVVYLLLVVLTYRVWGLLGAATALLIASLGSAALGGLFARRAYRSKGAATEAGGNGLALIWSARRG
ncbi:hypothetical protein SA2016_2881 [Sinomonas atrocyanea]|uniref:Polysaccharide biosynthesis protein n=3 Tax=Sinomonas atrocyanea TaxID=37927 RepID=A0A127A362_9MICC|nr:hypothetical protein SA2016_2881 [Sinomonas atrocyanea]